MTQARKNATRTAERPAGGGSQRTPASARRSPAVQRSGEAQLTPLCALPLVGPTTLEDAVFYGAVGAAALTGLVAWPTAALVGFGHGLHQRARNVVRYGTVGEAREGLIEAFDEVA